MGSLGVVDFKQYLDKMSDRVDTALEEFFKQGPEIPNLSDAARYSMGLDVVDRKLRGKRIRPVLCLLACESLGGTAEKAMPFALASEIMHNFFLVHDDIEDEDKVRRDRPAVWIKYGPAHGINVGDYLFAKTYQAVLGSLDQGLNRETTSKLTELVTKTIVHTGEGQALDINARKRRDMKVDDYIHVVTEKTGYYLACPALGGAIVAGANEDILHALEDYGKCIGPVFQITDDIIDLTEGKGRGEKGSDIKEGKRSYLVVYTSARCTASEKDRMFDILGKPREETTAEDVQWIAQLFEKYGAVMAGKKTGEEFLAKSQQAIAQLPEILRKNISAASDFMLNRKR